jgi:hypothetical protein
MPLSSSVTRRAFLAALSGVTAAAVLGGANSSALAQNTATPYKAGTPFTAEQCRNASIIITDIYKGYTRKGGLSREFTNGVEAWTNKGCQGPIETVAMIDNDELAFAEIRIRLIAMRMQSTAQPAAMRR